MDWEAFLTQPFLFQWTKAQWSAVLLSLVVFWVIQSLVMRILKRLNKALPEGSWQHAFFDSARGPLRWALLVAGIFIGLLSARAIGTDGHFVWSRIFNERSQGLWSDFFLFELPFALWYLLALIENLTQIWELHAAETESTFDDQLVPVVRASAKIAVVVLGGIAFAEGFGWSEVPSDGPLRREVERVLGGGHLA